jgi:hypothetical protein
VSRPAAGSPERSSGLFSERFFGKRFAKTGGREAARRANPPPKKAHM